MKLPSSRRIIYTAAKALPANWPPLHRLTSFTQTALNPRSLAVHWLNSGCPRERPQPALPSQPQASWQVTWASQPSQPRSPSRAHTPGPHNPGQSSQRPRLPHSPSFCLVAWKATLSARSSSILRICSETSCRAPAGSRSARCSASGMVPAPRRRRQGKVQAPLKRDIALALLLLTLVVVQS